jgi:hypothetical protein
MAISTLGNQIFLQLLRLYVSLQNAKITTSAEHDNRIFGGNSSPLFQKIQ